MDLLNKKEQAYKEIDNYSYIDAIADKYKDFVKSATSEEVIDDILKEAKIHDIYAHQNEAIERIKNMVYISKQNKDNYIIEIRKYTNDYNIEESLRNAEIENNRQFLELAKTDFGRKKAMALVSIQNNIKLNAYDKEKLYEQIVKANDNQSIDIALSFAESTDPNIYHHNDPVKEENKAPLIINELMPSKETKQKNLDSLKSLAYLPIDTYNEFAEQIIESNTNTELNNIIAEAESTNNVYASFSNDPKEARIDELNSLLINLKDQEMLYNYLKKLIRDAKTEEEYQSLYWIISHITPARKEFKNNNETSLGI